MRNYLTIAGTSTPLPREKFYVPGSLLRATIDNTQPLAYGLPPQVDMMFDNSPAYGLPPDEERKGIRSAVWFASNDVLSSGWAWGSNFLNGGSAAIEAPIGEGKLMLLGPEVAFRGQPFGTFKLLFNALHYARASKMTLPQN